MALRNFSGSSYSILTGRAKPSHNNKQVSRLLFISSVFPPDIGGPSQQTESITTRLAELNQLSVFIVPADKRVDPSKYATTLVIKVNDVGRGARGFAWRIVRLLHLFRVISEAIKNTRPTVAHIQVFGDPYGVVSLIACQLLGVATVLKLTGEKHLEWAGEHGVRGWRIALIRAIDAFQLRLTSVVWVTSPQFRIRLLEEYGLSSKKIFLLPNFIALAPFEAVALQRPARIDTLMHGLRVLCVARLRPWKGIEHTIRACAFAREVVASVTIVGDGDAAYAAKLRSLAEGFGIGARTCFLDAVPPNEIPGMYSNADVFILLSDYEPFGIVLVEAMAAGLPVVASRVGGIPSVLGELGSQCLVPAGDAKVAGQRLRALAADAGEWSRLSEAGRNRARNFGLDVGIERLTQVYSGLGAVPLTL